MEIRKTNYCLCEESQEMQGKAFCLNKCNSPESNYCGCSKYLVDSNSNICLIITYKYSLKALLNQLSNFSLINKYLKVDLFEKTYFISLSNDSYCYWGREIINNRIIQVSILGMDDNSYGRLIFEFKDFMLNKIYFNEKICPGLFIRHCDQWNNILYVIRELKSSTSLFSDMEIIEDGFKINYPTFTENIPYSNEMLISTKLIIYIFNSYELFNRFLYLLVFLIFL